MEVYPGWLSNYRRNLTRILGRKFVGKDFEHLDLEESNIDFMPEPFAVFQYYRYGIRHPLLAQRTKLYALVIDFGGGTFDTCIIETTKEGDISESGKNSRPLAAKSEPVGGFYVNQVIAEELFRKCVISKSESGKFHTALDLYKKWRKNELDLATTHDEYKNFINHFHESIYSIEDPKLSLCKSITDWNLDTPLSLRISIPLPKNPFSATTELIHAPFSASELREIFTKKVWDQRLKNIVCHTLQRGKEELYGASISVILLSGGSANIRWLEKLVRRDCQGELRDAEVLWLPDFQEVVAKGLAAECIRRFATEDQGGDFSSVTYNRLCLILDADKSGHTVKRFKPRVEGLPNVTDVPGVLLPSASFLGSFIDKPMRWRVQLGRAPNRQLDYYFLRSSFDPEDHNNLQNIEEHTIYTPPDTSFDANFQVELMVKQDGTAIPRFIYKSGRTEAETIAKTGKPFYLDMTYGQTTADGHAYIGLDFGTSNTSIAFVDESSVQFTQKRAGERVLSELVSTLPYPLSAPLAAYLGQRDPSKLPKQARGFIESALALAAYISYCEYCAKKGRGESKLFKGFTQRSAGPLWRFLQDCLMQLGKNSEISAPYQELLNPELYKLLNEAVDFVAQEKHDTVAETAVDLLRPTQILANISQKIFSANAFGFFEQVKRQKFTTSRQYYGLFRHASGSPPFIKISEYRGPDDFPEGEPFLLNINAGTALSLHPLMFWDICRSHPDADPGHCYIFDIQPEKGKAKFSFKAVGYPCKREVSESNEYNDLARILMEYREHDPKTELLNIGSVQDPLDQ
jgi:hypothetical protein